MRLWSLHPKYLDPRGLVALWREGLLAKKVLEGRTKGYKHHPQLERFRASKDPLRSINVFLGYVIAEADKRGYVFNRSKIKPSKSFSRMPVTSGQIKYEANHLNNKLAKRNPQWKKVIRPVLANPVFKIIKGRVEKWERVDR